MDGEVKDFLAGLLDMGFEEFLVLFDGIDFGEGFFNFCDNTLLFR